ncbi:hypothetical protein QBC38DRAFT_459470 [Podospora fimiseda]|uniref:Uncharacterized protein n=1 Tax=Podospora fimiseda TaxID=252190 RepID=A0AAN7BHB2_9PEZI|nr:hypothetical protein QBC38DRAFT_459470 [Podospora fimiseda]
MLARLFRLLEYVKHGIKNIQTCNAEVPVDIADDSASEDEESEDEDNNRSINDEKQEKGLSETGQVFWGLELPWIATAMRALLPHSLEFSRLVKMNTINVRDDHWSCDDQGGHTTYKALMMKVAFRVLNLTLGSGDATDQMIWVAHREIREQVLLKELRITTTMVFGGSYNKYMRRKCLIRYIGPNLEKLTLVDDWIGWSIIQDELTFPCDSDSEDPDCTLRKKLNIGRINTMLRRFAQHVGKIKQEPRRLESFKHFTFVSAPDWPIYWPRFDNEDIMRAFANGGVQFKCLYAREDASWIPGNLEDDVNLY